MPSSACTAAPNCSRRCCQGEAATRRPPHKGWVEDAPDVLRRCDVNDFDQTKFDINIHDRAMRRERERYVRVALTIRVELLRRSMMVFEGCFPIHVFRRRKHARMYFATRALDGATAHPRLAARARGSRGPNRRVSRANHNLVEVQHFACDLLHKGYEPLADLCARAMHRRDQALWTAINSNPRRRVVVKTF